MSLLGLQASVYGLALWLGMYLLARNPREPRLLLTGCGLTAYALSIATDALLTQVETASLAGELLARLHWPLLILPAFFWLGAIIYLMPEDPTAQVQLVQTWKYGLLPLTIIFYPLSAGTDLVFNFSGDWPSTGATYGVFLTVAFLLGGAALMLLWRLYQSDQPKRPLGLILVATLFFTLGAGLLLMPLNWLNRSWLLLAIGVDFVLLGVSIAVLDAFAEGEALLPDFYRTFEFSLLFCLLFGLPVGLTIAFGPGLSLAMLSLLLGILTLSILVTVWLDRLQSGLDWLAFAPFPHLRQARAEYRAAASALPKINAALKSVHPADIDEKEFARLTRRALSHLGNLPKLASSPLTQLPLIDDRLTQQNGDFGGETLERAAELKLLLTEGIERLKPRHKGDFGTTDEWRFYNALYFPYVRGLRPYSRRAEHTDLDSVAEEALSWFRTAVPQRTLYNWQNAAAKLVAKDLREQMQG